MTDSDTQAGARRDYDVAVLGCHLSTGLLAAILARNGIRTALIPTEADQQFPAGETTVPYTAELFFLLGSRFGVPGIAAMGSFAELPEAVRASSGVKRNLGFLYHRPGRTQQPAEALQFNVPGEHSEWHPYRPDVDRHAATIAVRHGARLYQVAARPGGVRLTEAGATIELAGGETVQAQYVVDGSAGDGLPPSVAAGPRGNGLRHRSTLWHAHLTGVRPFESLTASRGYGKASPWSAGTLLHAFDGGWVQVAPFGAAAPGHQRCSVAVSVDPAVAGEGTGPAAGFAKLLRRYPDLWRQFADAAPVQPWQQFSPWPALATQCAGPRWFLFDRAAGRHDLVLSRDVTMGLELVYAVAEGLLETAATGDWAGGGMKDAAAFQRGLFGFYDRFIAAGRAAAQDFQLWNAYLRVWLLWSILSALSLKRARLDGEAGTGAARWSHLRPSGGTPHWYPVPDGLAGLLSWTLAEIERVPHQIPAATAAENIFARLRQEPFVPPLYDFGDPAARYYYFTRSRRLRMLAWSKTTAPPDFRRLLTADNITAKPVTHGGSNAGT